MALPGEESCREVSACGESTYGDLPDDAQVQYVDGSYRGAVSDGSAEQPWTTIQDAVDAAAADELVAIAAGVYPEDVSITHPVRLHGRCPRLVEIRGQGTQVTTLQLRQGAAGSQVRGLSVTGPGAGIVVAGAEDVVIGEMWVHDTDERGIDVEDTLGVSSVVIEHSLFERCGQFGVFIVGCAATLDGVVVRDTVESDVAASGRGLYVGANEDTGRRATVGVRGSVIQRNVDVGLFVAGSDATLDGIVVRDTRSRASDGEGGRGISLSSTLGDPASVEITGCVVEGNRNAGVFVGNSRATLDATTIRNTLAQPNGTSGRGLNVQWIDPETSGAATQPADVVVRSSLIEGNRDVGVLVSGSKLVLEATAVRNVLPKELNGTRGRGVQAQESATLVMRHSAVEKTHEFGVLVTESTATLEAVLVHGTSPTQATGGYGDGVAVVSEPGPSSVTVSASRISSNARAGITNFGGLATVASTTLDCNPIQLNGQEYWGIEFSFHDAGDNVCGCGGESLACSVVSAGLEPPAPEP